MKYNWKDGNYLFELKAKNDLECTIAQAGSYGGIEIIRVIVYNIYHKNMRIKHGEIQDKSLEQGILLAKRECEKFVDNFTFSE